MKCAHTAAPKSGLGKELFPQLVKPPVLNLMFSPWLVWHHFTAEKNYPVGQNQLESVRPSISGLIEFNVQAEVCLNKQEWGEHCGLHCSVFSLEL